MFHAAKLDELKKSQEELIVIPGPKTISDQNLQQRKGSKENIVSRYISRSSIDSNDTLPMYNTDKKVSPELLETTSETENTRVPIIVANPDEEPVGELTVTPLKAPVPRRQSLSDKLLSANRRRSSGMSTFLEGRRLSFNPTSNLEETQESVSKNQIVTKKAKWEKIRQQTLRESTPIQGRKLSSVLQAAFPEIQRKIKEEKSAKAKQNWDKVRAVVFAPKDETGKKKRNTKLATLMITVLPDIATLHAKIHAPVIQDKSVTPYNNFGSFCHWFFMCPAFDDRGAYISIRKYHGVEYRRHKFLVDGLNPMSIFYSTIHLGLICKFQTTLLIFCL
ncbi:hypothetical protein BDR26DRAFT_466880 [Obelidium mucronatum]|nr:hypothetical protein BDR26DRAFT_466880 [Obelidium mucronatum]